MIQTRFATDADAAAFGRIVETIQALHAGAHPDVFQAAPPESLPRAEFIALLAEREHRIWVALDDGEVVGFLVAEVQRRPATAIKLAMARLYVHQMGVLPAARGRGIGTTLLAVARGFATDAGLSHVALDVWRFNDAAREFYQANGFTVMREELWSPV